MIKRLIICFILIGLCTAARATEPADSTVSIIDEINNSGTITVSAPEGLDNRLVSTPQSADDDDQPTTTAARRTGYRVLVFDDNTPSTAQHAAQSRRQQIAARFPEFAVYVQFNSPYWRVKVGDFRTRSDAENALAAIRQAFPHFASQLRIVRDHINSPK